MSLRSGCSVSPEQTFAHDVPHPLPRAQFPFPPIIHPVPATSSLRVIKIHIDFSLLLTCPLSVQTIHPDTSSHTVITLERWGSIHSSRDVVQGRLSKYHFRTRGNAQAQRENNPAVNYCEDRKLEAMAARLKVTFGVRQP